MSTDLVDRVQVYPVDSGGSKDWVFIKLTTREGVVGWGECYSAPDREAAIVALAERLGSYLVGRELAAIRHFMLIAFADVATKRGSMDFYCALSGLEAAMWDALGKSLGQPVYNLLGGPTRDRIRVYANGWTYNSNGREDDPQSIADYAQRLVAQGFTAIKLDPFVGPWRERMDREEERAAVALVAAVRDAVGADVDLMIEAHRRFDSRTGLRIARLLEPFDPFWLEEPVPSTDAPALRAIRDKTSIPLVTGEGLYTKREFRDVFDNRAVDIINPDVANCGGILELVEIAAMASVYGLSIAPHNYNSTTMALAATITAAALMPNFLVTEYFVNFSARGDKISLEPFEVENGFIRLRDRPGLGLELDESRLLQLVPGERAPRHLRRFGDEA